MTLRFLLIPVPLLCLGCDAASLLVVEDDTTERRGIHCNADEAVMESIQKSQREEQHYYNGKDKKCQTIHEKQNVLHVHPASTSTSTSTHKDSKENPIKFGHEMLNKQFSLLKYVNLNHGSFGSCPNYVLDYQTELRKQQEEQPDIFMRHDYKIMLNQTRYDLATKVLGIDITNDGKESSSQLVLVESASTAMNSILRSLKWSKGDIIICFSIEYPMFNNIVHWLQAKYDDIELIVIPIEYPIIQAQHENDNEKNEDDVAITTFTIPLQQTLDKLKEEAKIDRLKVAVFDHISSSPAMKLPIKQLSTITKKYNSKCLIIIDGAHALGQLLPIMPTMTQDTDDHDDDDPDNPKSSTTSISDYLGPIDVYISNGHKWFYSPKGSAILWIVNSSIITNAFPEPTVISSTNSVSHNTSIVQRYEYVSTRDYTNILSISKAIQFRQELCDGGDAAIYKYVRGLARQAKYHLLNKWNISVTSTTPDQLLLPDSMEEYMINIPLPYNTITNTSIANELMDYLLQQHSIYARIMPWKLHGNNGDSGSGYFYTRLSSQIYLELSDFVKFGDAVLQFIQERNLSQEM